jgi:hypothetical protein
MREAITPYQHLMVFVGWVFGLVWQGISTCKEFCKEPEWQEYRSRFAGVGFVLTIFVLWSLMPK